MNFKEPYIFSWVVLLPAKTGLLAAPVQSMLWQKAVATLIVTVLLTAEKPEPPSKKTSSVADGICVCKTAPPELVAQWLRSFQLPVPPTQ
jgi:hypothetical protein